MRDVHVMLVPGVSYVKQMKVESAREREVGFQVPGCCDEIASGISCQNQFLHVIGQASQGWQSFT